MPASSRSTSSRRPALAVLALIVVIGATMLAWRTYHGRSQTDARSGLTTVQQVSSGNLRIVVLSPTGTLRQGRNTYTIEFRSPGGTLVDVGTVRATANMPMPGMVMPAGLQLSRTPVPGRYEATAEFGMAGAWQMALEWDGPAGRGSVNFEGAVQ